MLPNLIEVEKTLIKSKNCNRTTTKEKLYKNIQVLQFSTFQYLDSRVTL